MPKWNLIFDVALCTGCHNCTIAVQDEYVGNSFAGYAAEMPRHGHRWVELRRRDRGSFPAVDVAFLFRGCQHCDDAPCLHAGRDGAVRKRPDGIVVIDPVRARGQRQIVDACPYGAVHWNEELKLPQHWNFDAHLIDGGWNAPRPVQACPTGALRALKVTDEEMQRIVETEVLVPLEQNGGHRPRVHYRNLYRFTHLFAAGTVFADQAAIETCIADAHVTLLRAETTIAEVKTDAFGDFRFDALPPLSGKYRVEIAAAGYRSQVKDFDLADNCWFGEIKLEPM